MKGWANLILGAIIMVSASAYTKYECGGNGIAADGSKVVPHCTVAVSRDLKHLMGKTISIEGVGIRRVNDIMNARWKHAIDVCVGTKDEALRFGRKKLAVKIMR